MAKEKINFYADKELMDKVRNLSKEQNRTVAELIREGLIKVLQSYVKNI